MAVLSWFLDNNIDVAGAEINAVTEPCYDPALFLLGITSDVLASTTSDYPFLTKVSVEPKKQVYAWPEPMVIYEFEPPYKKEDSFNVLRFRGLASNFIYTFVGVKPSSVSMSVFTSDVSTRTSTVFPNSTDVTNQGVICECTGSELGILIYDNDFKIINPFLLTSLTTLFKSSSRPSTSQSIHRVSDAGIVDLINTPYFFNGAPIFAPLFGSASLPAPPSVPSEPPQPSDIQPNTATQQPNRTSNTNTQENLAEARTSAVKEPADRIAARKGLG